MSLNTCNIAYDDIVEEGSVEFATHLVVLEKRSEGDVTIAPIDKEAETAITVTGCLSIAF